MWNGSAWTTVGNDYDINNSVYTIAVPDISHVYVGGEFTNVAGETGRDYIAMWNGSAWNTVGSAYDLSNGRNNNGIVRTIAAPDLTHVYVGGDFNDLGGVSGRDNIAMWNGSAWSTVGSTYDVTGSVRTIAAPDISHVYVGGQFWGVAGVSGRV